MYILNLISLAIISVFAEISLAAWEIIPRDNSTATDALNTLGCIQASNITVPLDIYLDDTDDIILQTNASLAIDDSDIKIIARCYWIFGFNIGYSLQSTIYDNQQVRYLGTLEQVLENKNNFPEVYRAPFYQSPVAANETQAINKRSKYIDYYDMFMSMSGDCGSNEQFLTSSDICQNINNPFYSYIAHNPNRARNLILNTWPHHRCEQGDFEYHFLPVDQWSKCKSRATYSWYGAFDGDECYGHESDTNCNQQEVDDWFGYFIVGLLNVGGLFWGLSRGQHDELK